MKRVLQFASVSILAMILIVYIFLPRLMLGMITEYDPFTFDYVLSDPELINEYGISNAISPKDYGYKSEVVDFASLDGTRLNGWYIQAKQHSDKCLILVHGRSSNRLKTMKYLALADSLSLDTFYNIFIPDLRNSGKSQEAKTFMGYKFAEDVTASMVLMNRQYGQRQFILYGFSMGAMAILNTIERDDLREYYERDASIEKIIFDSPLVNVRETLKDQTTKVPIANYFFEDVFDLYSGEINGYGDKMKLSFLLDPKIPTLILQAKNDKTTKANFLEKELSELDDIGNLEVYYFEGPGHVKLFQDGRTKISYINTVGHFLKVP